MTTLIERQAYFIYEAARLAAIAAEAPIIPLTFDEREDDFRNQFFDCVAQYVSDDLLPDPKQLHDNWMQAYFDNGWVYGETLDADARTHPDLVPYEELGQLERDKDDVFRALCVIAKHWIY